MLHFGMSWCLCFEDFQSEIQMTKVKLWCWNCSQLADVNGDRFLTGYGAYGACQDPGCFGRKRKLLKLKNSVFWGSEVSGAISRTVHLCHQVSTRTFFVCWTVASWPEGRCFVQADCDQTVPNSGHIRRRARQGRG